LRKKLTPAGVGVVIEAEHLCSRCAGSPDYFTMIVACMPC
jgi:GTP cyclohydrolase I